MGGVGWLVVTGGLVDCVVLKVGLVELVVLRSEKNIWCSSKVFEIKCGIEIY